MGIRLVLVLICLSVFQCSHLKVHKLQKLYTLNSDYNFKITNKYKRNELYFTEGLGFYDSNTLLESGGRYGASSIQLIDL